MSSARSKAIIFGFVRKLRNSPDKLGIEHATVLSMILYKYLATSRLDVLRKRVVRFTQPGDFNDPFEFRPRIEGAATDEFVRRYVDENFERLVDEELSKYGEMANLLPKELMRKLLLERKEVLPALYRLLEPDAMTATSQSLDRVFNQSVGIFCLSELSDSLLMWSHYADNHRGLVVGFDSEHAFFSKRRSEEDEFGFLRQVEYSRERPKVILADTSSSVWFQTKSADWSYEREWRIVRVLSQAEHRIEVAPFPVCLFEFPADCVLEIILGMRSTAELSKEVDDLALSFPRATLFRAREHPSEYSLLIDKSERGKSKSSSGD